MRKECAMDDSKPGLAPNADQLRAAIDSGKTGDKVAFPDPAAAPLGTDAEAAGVPPARVELNQAFTAETGSIARRGPLNGDGALPVLLGFLGLIAVAAVITFFIFAP
jgi:hypothetical protein